MEENKEVILIRKQNSEFIVNYPNASGNIPRTYVWMGTKGKVLNEKKVPFEVFDWLQNSTTTFQDGCLIIKETSDELINSIKENIADIEDVEESILTADEIITMLETGNHLVLKKALNTLTEGKSENLVRSIVREVVQVAQDTGIDSSKKREIVCEWAGIDYKNNDLLFDKKIDEDLEANSRK